MRSASVAPFRRPIEWRNHAQIHQVNGDQRDKARWNQRHSAVMSNNVPFPLQHNVALGKLLLANAVTDACCYLIGGRRPYVRKLQKTSYRIGALLSRKINFPHCFELLAGRIEDKGLECGSFCGLQVNLGPKERRISCQLGSYQKESELGFLLGYIAASPHGWQKFSMMTSAIIKCCPSLKLLRQTIDGDHGKEHIW
jgi:hypothetical protein